MFNVKRESPPTTIGLIVNPVAGMGGAVGLKGTDGEEVLKRALDLGAKPIAPERATVFLSELRDIERRLRLFVGAGKMGQYEATSIGFQHTVFGDIKERTTAEDTKEIAREMVAKKADLIVFCGGDGTAQNLLEAISTQVPVLGVPAGVKMHSSVFALTPEAAARIVLRFARGELLIREGEVMDVNEQAFREGRVSAKLYGYLLTPYEPFLVQSTKMSSPITESEIRNQAAIAIYVIEKMDTDVLYIIGPGTTTRTIGDLLDVKKTLLGVDIFHNRKIMTRDVSERGILEKTRGKKAKIIVTPIGGQGFVFGRGNQQISPKVIRSVGINNVVVVATRNKLKDLKSLKVDTGDQKLDEEVRAHELEIIIDYKTKRRIRVK